MTFKTTKECPQEVKDQLQKWLAYGWLSAEGVENEVEDVNDVTPPPSKPHRIDITQDPIEVQWAKRLKAIARKISKELDNQTISTNPRGYLNVYIFKFNSEGFCNMIDELLKNHSQYIKNYLKGTHKPTGVTYIFPFLGEIIKAQLFNDDKLQKRDLEDIFKEFKYNGSTAVSKMSIHGKLYRNPDARLLVETAKSIAKKYNRPE